MKIHEYQGKEILRKFGVTVPRGIPCMSVEEAVKAAETLGGPVWVVKAQIHAGGRGKGGGVKVAKSLEQVREYADAIMGMQLVTHQTGPEGQKVRRLLIEEGADIAKELYVSMVTDRISQRVVLMASSEGGMDIEEVAEKHPELIHSIAIDPSAACKTQKPMISPAKWVPEGSIADARVQLQGLFKAFMETDCSLAEINPLILTGSGKVIALDANLTLTRTLCSANLKSLLTAIWMKKIQRKSKRLNLTWLISHSTAILVAWSTVRVGDGNDGYHQIVRR
jgi:succinyl-CoA synthetase beta subunit